ncbi:MAG: DUF58 domain-containing protein [Acidobacteria bacterium]|nr:DUF58 domain-containing protein [Acidobacteriota bacterium]TDI50355.1 MAG: DUF58 domain-containing protein [Acidobacteriota bacterium]TDI54497.1 MAG: DUF58 domain-containing protein [Acidobacteriota bacterium]
MPTLRGWVLSGAGLALIILWWVFGDPELLLTGIFFVVAELAAIGYVLRHDPQLDMGRRLGSTTVHNGDTTTVTLVLRNRRRRPLRHLSIHDEVESLGMAVFEIAKLMGDETASATYRVTCRPRGVYRVGPARATTSDPLRLAELSAPDGPIDRLVVYPTVEELTGFPVIRGRDPAISASRPEHSQRGGEDFYTLREYQRGDDMRRIHWPYTAKTDELMIRQLETPWQSRALVLLDVRPSVYESADAFEMAVSGAASVVTHLVKSGFDADLWAGDPEPIDASRYSAAMERLALVEPNDEIDIEAVAGRIRQKGGGGALVLVTGVADRSLLTVQQLLSNHYRATLLMGASSTTSQTLVGFHRLGVATVTVDPTGEWASAWLSATRSSWTAVSAS